MNTVDLEAFVEVAASGHLTETAERMGIPQPTLSRRIARLETELGTDLFDRVGRSLVLNARGGAFLDYAHRVLAEVSAGVTEMRRLMDPELGTVRMGFMHSLGTWLVPSLLRTYRAQHPQVQFELRQGDAHALTELVLIDALDLALVAPAPTTSGVGWHELRRQRLALAVPQGHRLASRSSISLSEAADEPWIGMYPGYGIQILLERLSASAGFTPRIAFTTMEMTTVAGLVSAGLGVALLPMGDPYLAPSGLVLVPLEPRVDREIGLVWRSGGGSGSVSGSSSDGSGVTTAVAPAVEMFKEFVMRS